MLASADYYVMPSFDIFAKFGPAYVMQKVDADTDTVSKANKYRAYVNLGAGYTFDNNIYTNISYGHLFGKTTTDASKRVDSKGRLYIRSLDTVQLSVGYNFAI